MKKIILTFILIITCCEFADAQLIIASRGVTTRQRKERKKEPRKDFTKDATIGTWTKYIGIETNVEYDTYPPMFGITHTAMYRLSPTWSVGWGGMIGGRWEFNGELHGSILADLFAKTLSKSRFSPFVGMNIGYGIYDFAYRSEDDFIADGGDYYRNYWSPKFRSMAIRITPKIGCDIATSNKFGVYFAMSIDWYAIYNKHLEHDANVGYTLGVRF